MRNVWVRAFGLVLMALWVIVGPGSVEAWADPFVGSWTADLYEDWNIQDGITIQHRQASVVGARLDANHVQISMDGNSSVTLMQDGDILRLETRPLDVGDGLWWDCFLMSNGVNGAGVIVGQESNDPTDISATVAIWTGTGNAVQPGDLVGLWQVDILDHLNIRNIATEPFQRDSMRVQFTDLGGNQLEANAVDRPGYSWVLQLSGNRLSMVSGNPSADTHLFEMVTDGNTLSWVDVASEIDDPTDVSVGIGLAQKVPEPAGLGLLALGGVGLVLRRRRA